MAETARESLEVTVTSDPRLSEPRHAALVNLCRLLADQIDDAGDSASSRLTASYLSALKDLQRAMGEEKKEPSGGKLAQLRSVSGKAKSA